MTPDEPPNQGRFGQKRLSGPHPGENKYGEIDHYYFRCEQCGAEAVTKGKLRGCC